MNEQKGAVVRPLTLDDVDAWTRLLADEPHHDWSRALVQDEIVLTDRRAHGAIVDGVLLGAIAIQVITAASEVWILDVTVAHTARRRGLGRALVEVALAFGTREQSPVWLEVRESNSGARALYTQMGFVDVGRRKGYYAPTEKSATPEDAVLMCSNA